MNVNFLNLLTIIFIIAKLTGYIEWSWFLVLLPTIFSVGVSFIFLFVMFITAAKVKKR
jgi:ABC-type antimicrobial peptide transport system permease subunit